MERDCWYFAYGSNLLKQQMHRRTGRLRKTEVCRLPDYRFAFNKRGGPGQVYANIMPEAGAHVWGIIYRCSAAAMTKLDECEGVAGGDYHRQNVEVTDRHGATIQAVTYVAGVDHLCPEGRPSDEYLSKVLRGARQIGLPREYVERLHTLGTRERS